MTRDEALTLVREYVKTEGLVRHMLSVESDGLRFDGLSLQLKYGIGGF